MISARAVGEAGASRLMSRQIQPERPFGNPRRVRKNCRSPRPNGESFRPRVESLSGERSTPAGHSLEWLSANTANLWVLSKQERTTKPGRVRWLQAAEGLHDLR